MSYQAFLIDTLTAASQIAQDMFGHVRGTLKDSDSNQVLTEADLAISRLLLSRIQEHYPRHNVLDEEAGIIDHGSEYTWILDPIDGTSNFAAGVPTYGIMAGLLHGGQPIAGGIVLPAFHELYWAEHGQGAFRRVLSDAEIASEDARLTVSARPNLLATLVAYGLDGNQAEPDRTRDEGRLMAEITLNCQNLRNSNSCFDAVMVAQGKYGGSVNQHSGIWDNVAQHILIQEAGGLYTSLSGQPMDYTNPLNRLHQNYDWCAGPPALHAQLQSIIKNLSRLA